MLSSSNLEVKQMGTSNFLEGPPRRTSWEQQLDVCFSHRYYKL